MLAFIMTAVLIGLALYIGFLITGAFLSAFFWLFVRLPAALFFIALGAAFCVTLIFIPLGIGCFKLAFQVLL